METMTLLKIDGQWVILADKDRGIHYAHISALKTPIDNGTTVKVTWYENLYMRQIDSIKGV